MIRYCDLTEEQKAIICNGCGPKGGWITAPQFFLHEICDHHDFNYWLGCTWRDRLKADNQLYTAGRQKARRDFSNQTLVLLYYLAVRTFGASYFHYADRERDENDLAAFMEKKNPKTKQKGAEPSCKTTSPTQSSNVNAAES
jgi:hypothetical protein